MIKYTHKENQEMLKPIQLQAQMIGLLPWDQYLAYEKGGRGQATVIRAVKKEENGNRHPQMRPQWVPEFGYKDGPSIVGNALVRLSDVLYSVQKLNEEANRG